MESKFDLVAAIIESIDDDMRFGLAWETLKNVQKPVLNYINTLLVKCYDLERANESLQKRYAELERKIASEEMQRDRDVSTTFKDYGQ